MERNYMWIALIRIAAVVVYLAGIASMIFSVQVEGAIGFVVFWSGGFLTLFLGVAAWCSTYHINRKGE